MSYYQPLFDLMSNEHDLTLLESEMQDIIWVVEGILKQESKKVLLELIDNLPENTPLYKDSGLWQIRSDDMENVLCQQEVNESFEAFLKRHKSDL